MTDNFPTFDAKGNLLGNLTSDQGNVPSQNFALDGSGGNTLGDWATVPNYLQAIPSSFAPSQTSGGPVITSSGGASGSAGVGTGSAGTSLTAPSNAAATAQPAPASGVTSGSLADYFLRGVIVVLGFIFVAVGLNMFRPGVVPDPRRLVR
jgi:hypothetical protein